MVVVPVYRFQVTRVLVLLTDGIVQVDIHHLGQIALFGFVQQPFQLATTQSNAHILCTPGTDAQEIRHVRHIGRLDKLALQCGQGLDVFADQQSVGYIQDVLPLWLRKPQIQLVQKVLYGFVGLLTGSAKHSHVQSTHKSEENHNMDFSGTR